MAKKGKKGEEVKDIVYPRPNRRKRYWLCRDCIKGRNPCSIKCPDYVSLAEAAKAERARKENLTLKN